jgi:hypothetical protein
MRAFRSGSVSIMLGWKARLSPGFESLMSTRPAYLWLREGDEFALIPFGQKYKLQIICGNLCL